MPKRTFNTLDLPIDTEINWRINGYQGSGKIGSSGTEYSGPLGVCHDVLISVGGVDAHMPVFIVEHCDQDLLLGRPWERYVRCQASLKVARRSVRATFATFKNLGRPILGSGPLSDPGFMDVKISEFLALISSTCTLPVIVTTMTMISEETKRKRVIQRLLHN